jgi:hypothetical protein
LFFLQAKPSSTAGKFAASGEHHPACVTNVTGPSTTPPRCI